VKKDDPTKKETLVNVMNVGGATNLMPAEFQRNKGRPVQAMISCTRTSQRITHAWPNPSIERTSSSVLRTLPAAAHVKR